MKSLFLIALMIFGLNFCESQTTESISVQSPQEFKEGLNQNNVQLIDLRTAQEYNEGHISNAMNIDYLQTEAFTINIASLDKDKPVYIYCRSGNRSQKASVLLKERGFKRIIDLKGGYMAWTQGHIDN